MKYNPFKMWGSYVGAGIGGVVFGLGVILKQQPEWVYNVLIPFRSILNYIFNYSTNLGGDVYGYALVLLIFGVLFNILLGFLLGWTIHSIIRKVRQ